MPRHTALFACIFAVCAGGARALDLPLPRASSAVVLDGDLSDSAWSGAAVIDKFYEYQRSDNAEPPVRTVAYLTYDNSYLYVGIDCRDPEPGKIRAPYVDRDQVFGDMDNVAVLIDSRGEGKVGFQLRTNPRGIQADAVNNDASGSEDFSPDFFYDTVARVTPTGWAVEFRIPLSTLRYRDEDPKTWGVIVLRNWPRDFRYTMSSSPLPRNSNCFICHEIKLTGITGLPRSQHLITAPYVTGTQASSPRDRIGSPLRSEPFDGDAGVDVKWSPTPDMALDATLNPDFSQVEADVAQISTNQRFALFFPEKRPFFLEGSDLFETPIQAVYTRTITAPRFGIRGTGKIGSTAWTALVSDDRGGGSVIIPGAVSSDFVRQDFESFVGIGRARHEIGRSAIGALVTARENEGGGYNRVAGPDFEWRPTDADQVSGQYLFSGTENDDAGGRVSSHGARLVWFHNRQNYDWYTDFRDFGDGFRADNGFVPQVGYRRYNAGVGGNLFPENSRIVQWRGYLNADYYDDQKGDRLLRDHYAGFFVRATRNLGVQLEPHFTSVRTPQRDLIDRDYLFYSVSLNPSRRFPGFGINGEIGDAIDFANSRPGRGFTANVKAVFRPIDKIQTELTENHEQLDVRGVGRLFVADVSRIKTTYSFTAKSLLRAIVQYVDIRREPDRYLPLEVPRREGSFLGSLLYSYKLNWQTVLFVGYGDDRILDDRADLLTTGRTLFLKVSYAYQR